jgi:methyl-accepting chemotaxis protein
MNVVDESIEVLDSNVLLTALEALRRGDYSIRLPSGLSGANAQIAETLNDIILEQERRERERASEEVLDSKLLVNALVALRRGDFTVRLPSDLTGMNGKIADTLNDIIENSDMIAQEIVSVSRIVGHDGRLSQRATPPTVGGGWGTIINSVNALIDDLVRPTTEMARVIGAVAKGDLSQNMALEVDGRPLRGQFLRSATTANTMVDQLSSFASEVTRVAREVGTEGSWAARRMCRAWAVPGRT